jgi:hypothetical protein
MMTCEKCPKGGVALPLSNCFTSGDQLTLCLPESIKVLTAMALVVGCKNGDPLNIFRQHTNSIFFWAKLFYNRCAALPQESPLFRPRTYPFFEDMLSYPISWTKK